MDSDDQQPNRKLKLVDCHRAAVTDRKVEVDQCIAPNCRGTRCMKRTGRSRYCWLHLQRIRNLRIKKSTLPRAGMGVFIAKQAMPRGATVAEYEGPRLMFDPRTEDAPGGEYHLQSKRDTIIDGSSSHNIGSYVNDCRAANRRAGECKGCNCRFSCNRQTGCVKIVTTKRVAPQAELFVPYSRSYWDDKQRLDKMRASLNASAASAASAVASSS